MQKSDYTYTSKIDELRLDISHPNNRGKIFVFLEGDTDIRLYKKLCNENTAKLEVIPGGKHKVEAALNELGTNYKQIMGIQDADFLHVAQKMSPLPNLFLTDFHDLEMLLVACDDTFSAVIYEFCEDSRETHLELKVKLLKTIAFVGYCRWYNDKNNVELYFAKVGFGDLLDARNLTIDEKRYVERLLQQSKNTKNTDAEDIIAQSNLLMTIEDDLLQVCNGHDFMTVLAAYISSKPNNKGINGDTIARHFRIAYSLESFKKTKLYALTNEWAIRHNLTIYK